MKDSEPILRLENVHKAFGETVVLDGVDLKIYAGQTTVIIGPSGCGKSVLLKHMIGLLCPDSGCVFFGEHKISSLSEKRMVPIRQQMGFLFQSSALFDSMTVEQNICFPLVEHNVGMRARQCRRCREVLSLVGLDGLQERFPAELSGGQKKRVALARAIALGPQIIFYDEPTTALDPIRADLINELILKLQRALGNTAVIVTHDMASVRKVANRILMLHSGKFILDTTPDDLDDVTDEVVSRFVNGRASPKELAEIQTGQLGAEKTPPEKSSGETQE